MVNLKTILLVSSLTLTLTGCDSTFPLLEGGKGFTSEDIKKTCTEAGGKILKDKVQIGISTGIWTSSMTVSFVCDLSEQNQVKSELQKD